MTTRGSLFVVADGVGGAGGGAVASAEAAHVVAQEYYLNSRGAPARALRRAIDRANLHVYHLREGHPALAGMQTTVTALAVRDAQYWIGHVGDSKAFLLRGGAFTQLTRDHTVVHEMRLLGLVDSTRDARHPHRHLLTRTVGGEPLVAIDVHSGRLRPGDCFVLATDGVFEHLTPDEVRDRFADLPPEPAAGACIAEANRRGGFDNLTILAVRIGG